MLNWLFIAKLCEFLNIDWDLILQPLQNSVDIMWEKFKTVLLDGMHRFIPKGGQRVVTGNANKNFRPFSKELHVLTFDT